MYALLSTRQWFQCVFAAMDFTIYNILFRLKMLCIFTEKNKQNIASTDANYGIEKNSLAWCGQSPVI